MKGGHRETHSKAVERKSDKKKYFKPVERRASTPTKRESEVHSTHTRKK